MSDELRKWTRNERQYIKEEIQWFKAGAVLTSPSGDNINTMKLEQLEGRLEQINNVLDADDN